MSKRSNRNQWSWQEHAVDRSHEHVELRYGSVENGGWREWIPVAFIGPPNRRVFPVQFLLDRADPQLASMIGDTVRELDFYLVEKGEVRP
jgi:hypothetical protein